MSRTRAERIAQYENIKTKRRSYYNNWNKSGKIVHTACNCSCPMCGNPRKWLGEKTIQEQKFYQDELHENI